MHGYQKAGAKVVAGVECVAVTFNLKKGNWVAG